MALGTYCVGGRFVALLDFGFGSSDRRIGRPETIDGLRLNIKINQPCQWFWRNLGNAELVGKARGTCVSDHSSKGKDGITRRRNFRANNPLDSDHNTT